jgi:RNA-directed DNA polymerase
MGRIDDNLMEQVAAPENLLAAWRAVRGNIPKRRRAQSSGPDGVSLVDFEQDLTAQLNFLSDALLNGRYRPHSPKRFKIRKGSHGQRELAILTVTDRVAQRAAQQVLVPLWEPRFLPCSFGFRPGCSIDDALNYARDLRNERRWVVDGDICDCFPSIDHDILMKQVKRRVHDRRVLVLIQSWLDVGIMNAGPPLDDEGLLERVHTVSRWVEHSADWAFQRVAEETDPYAAAQYSIASGDNMDYYDEFADSPTPDRDRLVTRMRHSLMRRFLANGLMLGAGWMRSQIGNVGKKAFTFAKSPKGRRLLKKSALTSTGMAGVAAAAAITAYFINRKAGPAPTGILQGSPLSPLLANIYLHLFDLMMVKRDHALVRFADDWLILNSSRREADQAYGEAERSLDRLRLELNLDKTHIRHPNEKVKWLGGIVA